MNIAFPILTVVAAVIGQASDCYTTKVGFAHGFLEANPVGKWLDSKLGVNSMWWIKLGIYPVAATFVGHHFLGNEGIVLMDGTIAAIGFVAGILNYIALKKKNISVF